MEEKKEQNVFLYNRSRLEISGVTDVSEFTENTVELTLDDGCLGIDGEGLKIDFFSCDTGRVCIHGNVSALTYYSRAFTSKKKKKHS